MAQRLSDQLLEAFRAGASELRERSSETVSQIADSLNHVLKEAGSEGQRVKETLVRNWSSLERRPRRRPVPLLLGLLGLGVAAAYLARRGATASRG